MFLSLCVGVEIFTFAAESRCYYRDYRIVVVFTLLPEGNVALLLAGSTAAESRCYYRDYGVVVVFTLLPEGNVAFLLAESTGSGLHFLPYFALQISWVIVPMGQ